METPSDQSADTQPQTPQPEVDQPKQNARRPSPRIIALGIAGLVCIFLGTAYALSHRHQDEQRNQSPTSGQTQTGSSPDSAQTGAAVSWMQNADGFQPEGTPPACPAQMVSHFPADLTKATAILYPGQFRGGNYKPHSGLRFDSSANADITVSAPFDGTVIDGATYLADGSVNDVQYTFDVMNDCGMMFRVGHLLTLSPKMAAIARNFPAPVKNDSRTTPVSPGVSIQAGEVMATAVGTATDTNTFFDWGVYDWRSPNAVSTDQEWLKESQHNNSLAKHAVCWFNLISDADKQIVLNLPPGDPTSGKTSDYCK